MEGIRLGVAGPFPWVRQFYGGGRRGVGRGMGTVRLRGGVDHARVARFFERCMRRAEAAWGRMIYFFKRAGIDLAEEEKKPLPPWEQPYAQLEEYRELIWGRMQPQTKPPAPRRD